MLSFVVPAYNEEHELPRTLAAIHAAAQGFAQSYEIVVVDDDSNDATAEIARDAGARVVKVRCRQIAAVRNAGAHAARGDILFFVDADTWIDSGHVSGALDVLQRGGVGGSARVTFHDEVPRWGRILLALFAKIYFAANLGAGAFLFTNRNFFDRCGGFDLNYFAGEEIYFSKALKKLGRFTILRLPVLTSGRKLRMYSARHILSRSLTIICGGEKSVRSRAKLDLWYDGKRETAK
jgi:glycosyltransferase involved in cell wall biosynthesis